MNIPIFLKVEDDYVNVTAQYLVPHKYMALSEDSTQILYLDPHVIDFCLHEELHFCFITNPTDHYFSTTPPLLLHVSQC